MGLFDNLFGKKKKSQEDVSERTMLPWEVPGGQQYLDTLKGRISGLGVGYRPEILSGVTSAYAKSRRGNLEGYEIPSITSAASARGLGRSSIATSQIGRAEQEAGRDIQSQVADMALKDEIQRRNEINQAIQDLGGWVNMGVGASGQKAREGIALNKMYDDRSRVRKQETTDFQNKLISTGSTALGGLLGMIPRGGALGSLVSRVGGGQDINDTLSMINELQGIPSSAVKMSRAPVSYGGYEYNPPTKNQMFRLSSRRG